MRKTLILLLLAATHQVQAQDLKRNDPRRKAILEAVHDTPKYSFLLDSKFVVKRIWASPQWSYLCALLKDKDGNYQKRDDHFELYKIILSKQAHGWEPIADSWELALSSSNVNCNLLDKNISDAVLKQGAQEIGWGE